MLEYPIFKKKKLGILFLLPTLFILIVFLYYPLWQMFITSFYRSSLMLGTRIPNGIQNYTKLFTGAFAPAYRQVFLQTIFLILAVEFLGITVSLLLARLLTLSIRGLFPYQLLLLLTFALSPAVTGLIFSFLFNPKIGFVNQVLTQLFGVGPNWLGNGMLAMLITITGLVWKNIGYNVVFYIAAFQNIPTEIDDAAKIDGASGVQKLLKVSAPLLSPTTFFLIFTNLSYVAFESFGFIDVMTLGGPVGKGWFDNTGTTATLMYKIYQDGFGGSSNIGSAAAQAILLFILVIGITLLNYRVGSKKIQYGENT